MVKHHFLRGGRIHGKIARFFQAGPATGATAESSEWWKIPKPSEDGRGWLKSQILADFSEGWVPASHDLILSHDGQEDEHFFCIGIDGSCWFVNMS